MSGLDPLAVPASAGRNMWPAPLPPHVTCAGHKSVWVLDTPRMVRIVQCVRPANQTGTNPHEHPLASPPTLRWCVVVKRLETLALILFPLIALVVVLHVMAAATESLNDTWQEQTQP